MGREWSLIIPANPSLPDEQWFVQELKSMVSQSPDVSSLAEVLDRILDKGIVVDLWVRISLVGIELLTIEARVVVASVDTFLHYAEEITKIEQAAIGAPA